jgi:hemolysin III
MGNSYRPHEEIANSITHGIGALLSLAGLPIMVVFASLYGKASHVVASAIFGSTLLILYLASTLYHSFSIPKIKRFFKIVDHICIYLLIAGTYTPFTLITLRGAWGWTLFGIVWGLALVGIIFKFFFAYRFKLASTLAYIAMGWVVIFAIKPLIHQLPPGGLIWLLAGGLAYTFGTLFYIWESIPFHHAIWHGWVLLGSVCHFCAVFFYVIPTKNS